MSHLERFYQALMHKEPDIVPVMLFPIRTEEVDVKYVTVLNINDQKSLARGLEFTLSFFRKYPDVMPFGGLAPSYPDMTFGSLFGSRPMSSPDGAYMPSPAFKDLKEAVRTLEIPTDFHKEKGLWGFFSHSPWAGSGYIGGILFEPGFGRLFGNLIRWRYRLALTAK